MPSPPTANLHHLQHIVGSRNLREVHQLLHRAQIDAMTTCGGAIWPSRPRHIMQAYICGAAGGRRVTCCMRLLTVHRAAKGRPELSGRSIFLCSGGVRGGSRGRAAIVS
eukprot:4767780-Pyramimonas_sp.AAC.1